MQRFWLEFQTGLTTGTLIDSPFKSTRRCAVKVRKRFSVLCYRNIEMNLRSKVSSYYLCPFSYLFNLFCVGKGNDSHASLLLRFNVGLYSVDQLHCLCFLFLITFCVIASSGVFDKRVFHTSSQVYIACLDKSTTLPKKCKKKRKSMLVSERRV